MKRIAFKMSVLRGAEKEYEARHNPIWPELQRTLLAHGVRSYSIFLDEETNALFAYAEIDSEEQWDRIAETEVCRKWWTHMAPLMPTNEDASPQSTSLRELFHIEQT
ncbi:L-rhamnose mutarotase [candidate division KSB1 bacterium]|nr:L-rhamnose mutarotase [candidate division KSB1 bacterium]